MMSLWCDGSGHMRNGNLNCAMFETRASSSPLHEYDASDVQSTLTAERSMHSGSKITFGTEDTNGAIESQRSCLVASALTSAVLMLVTAFQWSLVDLLTPFLLLFITFLWLMLAACFAWASVRSWSDRTRLGWRAGRPVFVCTAAAAIAAFVPFTVPGSTRTTRYSGRRVRRSCAGFAQASFVPTWRTTRRSSPCHACRREATRSSSSITVASRKSSPSPFAASSTTIRASCSRSGRRRSALLR
jgi:hypothetical protein